MAAQTTHLICKIQSCEFGGFLREQGWETGRRRSPFPARGSALGRLGGAHVDRESSAPGSADIRAKLEAGMREVVAAILLAVRQRWRGGELAHAIAELAGRGLEAGL